LAVDKNHLFRNVVKFVKNGVPQVVSKESSNGVQDDDEVTVGDIGRGVTQPTGPNCLRYLSDFMVRKLRIRALGLLFAAILPRLIMVF
jgi:hypothetical protein